jgi:excisionase family DNA binding protein
MQTELAISIDEAARRLGVCRRTVINLLTAKELVSRRIGRRRVIPVTSLEALLRRDAKTTF